MPGPKDKKDKKDAPAPKKTLHIFEFVAIVVIGYMVLSYLYQKVHMFSVVTPTVSHFFDLNLLYSYWLSFVSRVRIFSFLLSLFFAIGAVYSSIQLQAVNRQQRALLYPPPKVVPKGASVNPKWQRVLEHTSSSNPADWKLAILEADIMLDEMLDRMGYRGETMGEKLKTVARGDFATLDNAWEAHKIRNAIAHEGSDFLVSEREAKRVIFLYQSVFKEFKYI